MLVNDERLQAVLLEGWALFQKGITERRDNIFVYYDCDVDGI